MTSRIIVAASVTIDGVMQAPAGPDEDSASGFAHGGWMAPFVDEGFAEELGEVFAGADAMLLGRRSYDLLASYWPQHPEEEGAAQLNGMRKYAVTRHDFIPAWNNTRVLVGDAAVTVAELKVSGEGRIVVQGSSDLLRTLQRERLIDEYHLLIFPVVLGSGKRMFATGTVPAAFRLRHAIPTRLGVIRATYDYDGEPQLGLAV